jgi:hypothetical protein
VLKSSSEWRLPCNCLFLSQSQSYVTTDGQPASLSGNKAPIWGLRPDLDYCLTVAGLLIWGAISNERTGLSFSSCPPYNPSARTTVEAPVSNSTSTVARRNLFVCDLSVETNVVSEPLASNGCFSGSTILALSKYSTI